jgi:hypothetical protein
MGPLFRQAPRPQPTDAQRVPLARPVPAPEGRARLREMRPARAAVQSNAGCSLWPGHGSAGRRTIIARCDGAAACRIPGPPIAWRSSQSKALGLMAFGLARPGPECQARALCPRVEIGAGTPRNWNGSAVCLFSAQWPAAVPDAPFTPEGAAAGLFPFRGPQGVRNGPERFACCSRAWPQAGNGGRLAGEKCVRRGRCSMLKYPGLKADVALP